MRNAMAAPIVENLAAVRRVENLAAVQRGERLSQSSENTNKQGPAMAGLFFGTAVENTSQLLEGGCSAALITAIDFAKNSSEFSLYLPAVSSRGESRAIFLRTKPGIRTIRSVAFGDVASADVVLAKIILAEKYELDVAFQPASGTIEDRLLKADAVLVSGDEALLTEPRESGLDLVDEWSDLTELPFVHLVCAGKESENSKELSLLLRSAAEGASGAVDTVAVNIAMEKKIETEKAKNYLTNFAYILNDDAIAGVNEFFRYAFYLGMLPDIPDVRRFTAE